jgi:hypothetical protein
MARKPLWDGGVALLMLKSRFPPFAAMPNDVTIGLNTVAGYLSSGNEHTCPLAPAA